MLQVRQAPAALSDHVRPVRTRKPTEDSRLVRYFAVEAAWSRPSAGRRGTSAQEKSAHKSWENIGISPRFLIEETNTGSQPRLGT